MINNKRVAIIALLILIVGGIIFLKDRSVSEKVHSSADTARLAIDELTSEKLVVPYVKKHKRLPDYYIKKSEARKLGWVASEGNLCEAVPGKAIGGDVFFNRENNLPSAPNRKWFEADLNYHCGRRNADRLLFSSDGIIFVTYDHYKTFEQR